MLKPEPDLTTLAVSIMFAALTLPAISLIALYHATGRGVESVKRTIARRRYAILRKQARDKIIEKYNRGNCFYNRDTIRWIQDHISSGSLNISFSNRAEQLVDIQVCPDADKLEAARNSGEKTVPADQTIIGRAEIWFNSYHDLVHPVGKNKWERPAWEMLCSISVREPWIPHHGKYDHLNPDESFFQKGVEMWRKSTTCANLKRLIRDTPLPDGINKVISFGSYRPLSLPSDDGSIDWDSMTQHAALLTLKEEIQKRLENNVTIYAQDPAYVESDKSFLVKYDIQVLDGAKGLLEVDDFTVVFSLYPSFPLLQILADFSISSQIDPAIIITNEIEFDHPRSEFLGRQSDLVYDPRPYRNPVSTRVWRMMRDYSSFRFDARPRNDELSWAGPTRFYVRKDDGRDASWY